MVYPMLHLNTPWKNTHATMQPSPFTLERKYCHNATILTLASWCFLPGTTCRCYRPNARILILESKHCHPVATVTPLPSVVTIPSNACIPMLPSKHYHPDNTKLTTYCCIIRNGSQKHTICTYSFSDKLKQKVISGQNKINIIGRKYGNDATIQMLPFQASIPML